MSEAAPEVPLAPAPAPPAAPVRVPVWQVSIGGHDVTREISPWVIGVTYTDNVHGASDEVEIQVHDSDGRWRGEWSPKRGDHVELHVGYEGEPLLPCGRFEVDECELVGPPSVLTIRGLAAGATSSLRTARSEAYEHQTLRGIAGRVARRHGLRLQGEISDLQLGRVTQDREDDLAFLTRLADGLGYAFSVRGDLLVFYEVESLERLPPSFTILEAGSSTREYRVIWNSRRVYRACTIRYHQRGSKQTLSATVAAPGVTTGDTYEIKARAENRGHAEQLARAALQRVNSRRKEGEITVEGDPRAVAGVNVTLSGWGDLDGVYLVTTSRHRVSRSSGYETIINVRSGGEWDTASGE